MSPRKPYHGRGAPLNPNNRFEKHKIERDEDWLEPDDPAPTTRFFEDRTRRFITHNKSPDVGFGASINPYRGCEHGCIYCYARPTHEYLGLNAGLDFESKIFVKQNAAELLRKELSSPHWKPEALAMSGVTDCYQPAERRLKVTRACLEVLAEFRNPVSIITKNSLIVRDIDLLQELARYNAVYVTFSVTTLDVELCNILEPRTARPKARLDALRQLRAAGIPAGINIAPVIPGLNDQEIPKILKAAKEAGAISAGFGLLRLPYAVNPLFQSWLGHHRRESKDRILHLIEETRGGQLNSSEFGTRMRGTGLYAEQMRSLFTISRRKAGYPTDHEDLSIEHFRRPSGPQLDLFEV